MTLKGKRILLGVTGGIAAYKAAELARLLVKDGCDVRVAMTEAASALRHAGDLAGAVRPAGVHRPLGRARCRQHGAHRALARRGRRSWSRRPRADFIAKLAHGLADDLLSTLCLARNCPLLVAPAMNGQMWENAGDAAQRRAAARRRRRRSSGPAAGDQACGEVGMGRMLEPRTIAAGIVAFLQPKLLAGNGAGHGGTDVRSRSTRCAASPTCAPGKMGYAIARAAREAGAEVTLVSGPTALRPAGVDARRRDAARREMFNAVKAHVEARTSSSAWPRSRTTRWPIQRSKLKITHRGDGARARAQPGHPRVRGGRCRSAPFCVGFAAESENLAQYAEAKRRKKSPADRRQPRAGRHRQGRQRGHDLDDTRTHPLRARPKLGAVARQARRARRRSVHARRQIKSK